MHRPDDGGRVVLPCTDLDPTLSFFLGLGFRVEAISPADAPTRAVLAGRGLRLELQRGASGDSGLLRFWGTGEPVVAPNGTRIEWVDPDPPLVLPLLRPSLVVARASGGWGVGRAGMEYRDLLPGRQGGRFVASAIRIPAGGPVPDYVHHHRVRCQLIYCVRGRVRVVYEDQGDPFWMVPGDCVLQPPGIRHRVLESDDGLVVVEVGCPAEHETLHDPDLALPTEPRPGREWDGQRFVRHVGSDARWTADGEGFERADTGISAATGGLLDVAVIRGTGARTATGTGELLFRFVLDGSVVAEVDGRSERLDPGDALTVPPGSTHRLTGAGRWLEVSVG